MPVKPWQMAVMALAVLAVIGSSIYACSMMGERVTQAKYATMVDIRSGELFEARYPEKRPVHFPAKHPTTGELTLYPVFLQDNKWVLNTRYMSAVRAEKTLKDGLITDAKTGEIIAASEKPKRVDIF
jgi:hypothetical protein